MNKRSRELRDALHAFEAAGHPVRGLRLYTDGTIDLLTEAPPDSPVTDDDGDWMDLVGNSPVKRPSKGKVD